MSTEEENYVEPIFPLTTKEGKSPGEEEDIDLIESFTFGEQSGGKYETRTGTEGIYKDITVGFINADDFLKKHRDTLLNCFEGYVTTTQQQTLPPIYNLIGKSLTQSRRTLNELESEYIRSNLQTTPVYYLFKLFHNLDNLTLVASGKSAYNKDIHGVITPNQKAFTELNNPNKPTGAPTVEDQIKWFQIPTLGEIIVRLYLLSYVMVINPTKMCLSEGALGKGTPDQFAAQKKKKVEEQIDYLNKRYIGKNEKNSFSDYLGALQNNLPLLKECFLGPGGYYEDLEIILNLAVPFGKNLLYTHFFDERPIENDVEKNKVLQQYYVDSKFFKDTNDFLTQMTAKAKELEAMTPPPGTPASSSTTTPPPPPPPPGPKQATCDDIKKYLDDTTIVPNKLAITSDQITQIIEALKKDGLETKSSFIIQCIVLTFNTDPANPVYDLFIPQDSCDIIKDVLDTPGVVADTRNITDDEIDAIVKRVEARAKAAPPDQSFPNFSKPLIEACISKLGPNYRKAPAKLPAVYKVADCKVVQSYLDDPTLVADPSKITDDEVNKIISKSTLDGYQTIKKITIELCLKELNKDPAKPTYGIVNPTLNPGVIRPADSDEIRGFVDYFVADRSQITDDEIEEIRKKSEANGFIGITKPQIQSNFYFWNPQDGSPPIYGFASATGSSSSTTSPPPPATKKTANCNDIQKYLDDATLVVNKLAINDAEINAITVKSEADGFVGITKADIQACLGTLNPDPANPIYGFATSSLPPPPPPPPPSGGDPEIVPRTDYSKNLPAPDPTDQECIDLKTFLTSQSGSKYLPEKLTATNAFMLRSTEPKYTIYFLAKCYLKRPDLFPENNFGFFQAGPNPSYNDQIESLRFNLVQPRQPGPPDQMECANIKQRLLRNAKNPLQLRYTDLFAVSAMNYDYTPAFVKQCIDGDPQFGLDPNDNDLKDPAKMFGGKQRKSKSSRKKDRKTRSKSRKNTRKNRA